MALPIMKIFTAIKNDYNNLRLERGWINMPLLKDPEIRLVITPYNVSIKFGILNKLDIPYEDNEDLTEIQDCITNVILFVRDFIEEINEFNAKQNKNLLTEGNTIWVKENIK